ncbi:hypothetical protein N7G274_002219 [Stereocaulon virgatum]|uniref:Small ribosomal subunit protein mS35 mitochondrial conserved domain-containing protein n=1 Tax=Stereocaulon virgatum TaxID=373712 RepID=A0ABR4AQQ8_9LECA
MAASISRLGYVALRHTSQTPGRRKLLPLPCSTHQFHISSIYRARNDTERDPSSSGSSKRTREPFKFNIQDLSSDERAAYHALTPEERAQWRKEAKQMHDYMTSPEVDSLLQGEASNLAYETARASPHFEISIPKIKPGLMAMGELNEQDSGEDEEFEGDDITALGHGELEQHREMREYARIAAWEMPLLSKSAKPFEPPPADQPLRFRYTTYMGENHPGSNKIVLEFCTRDLQNLTSITEPQRIKLIKLVGPRYNPETDIVKMSSEMFETQAQNKRYLGDLVDTLLAEAKNEEDMFEDVPLDFRHHKFKRRAEFPEEWKLNKERMALLEEKRQNREEVARNREEEGKIVIGSQIIEEAMQALPVRDMGRESLEAQRGMGGKLGKGRLRALR